MKSKLIQPFNLAKYTINSKYPFYLSNRFEYIKHINPDVTKGFLLAFKNLFESIEDKNYEFLKNITEENLYNSLKEELEQLDNNNYDLKINNYEILEKLEEEINNKEFNPNENKNVKDIKSFIKNYNTWNEISTHFTSFDKNIAFNSGFNAIFGAKINRKLNQGSLVLKNSYFNPKRTYYFNGFNHLNMSPILMARVIFRTNVGFDLFNKETNEIEDYDKNIYYEMDTNTKQSLVKRIPKENILDIETDENNYYCLQFETYEEENDWILTDFNGLINENQFYN